MADPFRPGIPAEQGDVEPHRPPLGVGGAGPVGHRAGDQEAAPRLRRLDEGGAGRQRSLDPLHGDVAQEAVVAVEAHRGRERTDRRGGQVGPVGIALDQLQRGDPHRSARIGTGALVAGEEPVGREHSLDDAGDRVLDAHGIVVADAEQDAGHADQDALLRVGLASGSPLARAPGLAVEPQAPVHQRLAHRERQLVAPELHRGSEAHDVGTGGSGRAAVVGGADEDRGAEGSRVPIDLVPRGEATVELAVEEPLGPRERLTFEAAHHECVARVLEAAVGDGDLQVGRLGCGRQIGQDDRLAVGPALPSGVRRGEHQVDGRRVLEERCVGHPVTAPEREVVLGRHEPVRVVDADHRGHGDEQVVGATEDVVDEQIASPSSHRRTGGWFVVRRHREPTGGGRDGCGRQFLEERTLRRECGDARHTRHGGAGHVLGEGQDAVDQVADPAQRHPHEQVGQPVEQGTDPLGRRERRAGERGAHGHHVAELHPAVGPVEPGGQRAGHQTAATVAEHVERSEPTGGPDGSGEVVEGCDECGGVLVRIDREGRMVERDDPTVVPVVEDRQAEAAQPGEPGGCGRGEVVEQQQHGPTRQARAVGHRTGRREVGRLQVEPAEQRRAMIGLPGPHERVGGQPDEPIGRRRDHDPQHLARHGSHHATGRATGHGERHPATGQRAAADPVGRHPRHDAGVGVLGQQQRVDLGRHVDGDPGAVDRRVGNGAHGERLLEPAGELLLELRRPLRADLGHGRSPPPTSPAASRANRLRSRGWSSCPTPRIT